MSATVPPTMTVRELIERLRDFDPDAPVLVSTHYDNDIGHASRIDVMRDWMVPTEGDFWDNSDPADAEDGAVQAVVVTAWG